MLVLSRKTNQEIMIGNSIRIVVLKVAHGKVKLGITAPSDVTITREELCLGDLQTAPTASELDGGSLGASRVEGKA